MGADKAGVRLGRMTLMERAAHRLNPQVTSLSINTNAPIDTHDSLPYPTFSDLDDTRPGPLGGILAALVQTRESHPQATHVCTVPTDSPFFPLDLVERLADHLDRPDRIAVAISSSGLHPVFGLWPVALADDLAGWLHRGESLRLRAWLDRHGTVEVLFPDLDTPRGPLDAFFNINTPVDLANAERWLEALEA